VVWEGWHREVSPYPDQYWATSSRIRGRLPPESALENLRDFCVAMREESLVESHGMRQLKSLWVFAATAVITLVVGTSASKAVPVEIDFGALGDHQHMRWRRRRWRFR
jgi:hypothetical protein